MGVGGRGSERGWGSPTSCAGDCSLELRTALPMGSNARGQNKTNKNAQGHASEVPGALGERAQSDCGGAECAVSTGGAHASQERVGSKRRVAAGFGGLVGGEPRRPEEQRGIEVK